MDTARDLDDSQRGYEVCPAVSGVMVAELVNTSLLDKATTAVLPFSLDPGCYGVPSSDAYRSRSPVSKVSSSCSSVSTSRRPQSNVNSE